jgi:hypothetical protein
MSSLKTLGLAIGLAFAASTFAFAQQPAPQQPATQQPAAQQSNPASNAAASGGSGTHQTSQKTGSAANNQKVLGNQQGYRGTGRTASRRVRGSGLYASMGRCRMIHRPGSNHLVKVCHWR